MSNLHCSLGRAKITWVTPPRRLLYNMKGIGLSCFASLMFGLCVQAVEMHRWGESGGITPFGMPGQTINNAVVQNYWGGSSDNWSTDSVWHGLNLTQNQEAKVTIKITSTDPAGSSMYCHILTSDEFAGYKIGNRLPRPDKFDDHAVLSVNKGGNGATWTFTVTAGEYSTYNNHIRRRYELKGEGRSIDFVSTDEIIYFILAPIGSQSTSTVSYSITCDVKEIEQEMLSKPVITSVSRDDSDGVTICWRSVANAVKYNVYRLDGVFYTPVKVNLEGTSCFDSKVEKGVEHEYIVQAVDAYGNKSVYSDPAVRRSKRK